MAKFNFSRTVFSECSTMRSSMRIPVRKTNVVASALVAIIVSHDHATSGQHRCHWKKNSLCSTARTFNSDVASLKRQKITPNFAFSDFFRGHDPNSKTFVTQHPLSQIFGHFQRSSENAVFLILSERHEMRHSEYFIMGTLDEKCYCLQIIQT